MKIKITILTTLLTFGFISIKAATSSIYVINKTEEKIEAKSWEFGKAKNFTVDAGKKKKLFSIRRDYGNIKLHKEANLLLMGGSINIFVTVTPKALGSNMKHIYSISKTLKNKITVQEKRYKKWHWTNDNIDYTISKKN